MKMLWLGIAGLVGVVLVAGFASAAPKIKGEPVDYTAGGVTMKGYLAYDENIKGKRPGVLVVHEWWGHNEYARKRARMLAELGYTALAVDMYGDGKTAMHPDDAGKFSSELMKNFDTAKVRFEAAEDFLKKQPTVDPDKDRGHRLLLRRGRGAEHGPPGRRPQGSGQLHGSMGVVKSAEAGMVKAKLRVYNGADDKFIPAEAIEAFKKEMTGAKVDFKVINYPGAIHSFTNPDATELGKKFNLPLAYNEKADKESWADMTKFFNEVLKK